MKIQNNKIVANGLILAVLTLNLSAIQPAHAQTGSSTYTGSLNVARLGHNAKLLSNGKVLVMDGWNNAGTVVPQPELYDPATGTWTVAPMNYVRFADTIDDAHTTTVLTNGKVLVVGGESQSWSGGDVGIAELFDPATGTWTNTGALNYPRYYHTATLLPNGEVLVAGGLDENLSGTNYVLSSVEIYNPATGLWTTNTPMLTRRFQFSANLLSNGKILFVGGGGPLSYEEEDALTSAEIYDPGTGTATPLVLNNAAKLSSGAVQIGFSNAPGANFTALATTNFSTPFSNWTPLGVIPEISPGLYQFTDTQVTNMPERFYRVSSP